MNAEQEEVLASFASLKDALEQEIEVLTEERNALAARAAKDERMIGQAGSLIALLIAASGGTIRVPDALYFKAPVNPTVSQFEDPATRDVLYGIDWSEWRD